MSTGEFNDVVDGYLATMVPSLRSVAARVVERAALSAGERVLDAGTGTGLAAGWAVGEAREVLGIDVAPAMLGVARQTVRGATFREMDYSRLAFADREFDVVLASHSLLFAEDRRATLREWRRVACPGGRLSLSVPGPVDVTPTAIYAEVYERHGIDTSDRYPTREALAAIAEDAGWTGIETEADPDHEIVLADAAAFATWRGIGSRGAATAGWSAERHARLTAEMLAVTPRDATGAFHVPFGAIYLIARSDGAG